MLFACTAVAALELVTARSSVQSATTGRPWLRALAWLLGAVLIAPPLLTAFAVCGAAIGLASPHRAGSARRLGTALAAIGLASGALQSLAPRVHASGRQPVAGVAQCLGATWPIWPADWSVAVAPVVDAIAPIALVLPLVAVVSRVEWSLRLIVVAGGIGTALLLLAASPEPSVACVPVVAAAWLLAARGADDIARDATGSWRLLAVAAVAMLFPALQASHARLLPPRVRSISLGQHDWSMRSGSRLWVLLPRRASLVQEDSGFDLLTRALPARR